MGSIVSVPKSPDRAMKQRFSISPESHQFSVSSPIKAKAQSNEDPGPEIGDEETFFDSQAWLDFDREDDFVSENGDFTPSRSNTPVHHSSLPSPQLTKSQFIDRAPNSSIEPPLVSPTDNKKRLSEFLQESLAGEEVIHSVETTPSGKQNDQLDNMSPVQLPKSVNGISYPFPFLSKSYSVRSRDRTPDRYSKQEKAKPSNKPTGGCLPTLVTSLSFKEKRKRW